MKGSLESLFSRSARMLKASSSYSWAISHLGDSGNQGTVPNRMMMKIHWKAKGNLQEIGPPTYEKPYVIQLESEKPAMFMINSMTTNLPRHLT
ncbi:hypothetical protein ES702_04670 [subsurface metagenome]